MLVLVCVLPRLQEFVDYGEELQALAHDMYSLIKPLEFDDYSAIRASLEKLQVRARACVCIALHCIKFLGSGNACIYMCVC